MRTSIGYLEPLVFFFGVTFVHANLCTHMLALIIQDGGNPFLVTRLPALTSVTDSSRHSLLLTSLLRLWSHQVYIIHRSITGFLVVQEATCTHAHEYRLLGASSNLYNAEITLDRDLSGIFGIDRKLKLVTFTKHLNIPRMFFIHCDLVDKQKNLLNGQPSTLLARSDILGKPFEKNHSCLSKASYERLPVIS